jgi:hypothetical protein
MTGDAGSYSGALSLCTYLGTGVYLDGTVSLVNPDTGKILGIFHLTATRPGNGDTVLEFQW